MGSKKKPAKKPTTVEPASLIEVHVRFPIAATEQLRRVAKDAMTDMETVVRVLLSAALLPQQR